jgi:hypothetical protein
VAGGAGYGKRGDVYTVKWIDGRVWDYGQRYMC